MMTTQLNINTDSTLKLLDIQVYEQYIADNPKEVSNYWYLGLVLLLEGKEDEAQITWMTPFLEFGEQDSEQWLQQLTDILLNVAQEKERNDNYQVAWVIRQHIREFIPDHINNLL